MPVFRASPSHSGLNHRKCNALKGCLSWVPILGALVVGFLIGHLNARGSSAGLGLRGRGRASWRGRAQAEESYLFDVPSYGVPGPVEWNCLPEIVQNEFRMNGSVEQRDWLLLNNKRWAGGEPVNRIRPRLSWWHGLVQDFLMKAHTKDFRKWTAGPQAPIDLLAAIEAYPVTGKSVLVVGSREPWVEALVMSAGARHVSTTAYNNHTLDRSYSWWTLIHEDDLDARKHKFDVIVAYAILERLGTGRFGEFINPNADLEQMHALRNFMNPGGICFMAVPVGTDAIWFNAHRIYGKVRFPQLIEGWEYLGVHKNYTLEKLFLNPVSEVIVNPVIVLRAP